MKKLILMMIIVLTLCFLYGCAEKNVVEVPGQKVTNFEDCIATGSPVMESQPRQCKFGGVTFTEEIELVVEPECVGRTDFVGNCRELSDNIEACNKAWQMNKAGSIRSCYYGANAQAEQGCWGCGPNNNVEGLCMDEC